ncbi:N-acetylmuramoyl-L-alanine amidase [Cumulibacter manganitolerans]|uniref:N-acetylmuramoyl-L-alanine amidase n=1 Tax=Cumulibacter manganitolerans TaxID=1884992 RepID=UPI0012966996|nr:N-acetylmuramoyl-L-alanine amidase [Cumulibacter manganitolerans]
MVLPVVSFASPPAPVAPAVQNIALGSPGAPAAGVDVVDPKNSAAPAPKSETPTASSTTPDPSTTPSGSGAAQSSSAQPPAAPSSAQPQPTTTEAPSQPATPGAGKAQDKPAPSDETQPAAPMPVPDGSQTLVLDKGATKSFSSVGVSWKGDAPLNGIALQIRVKATGSGQWSEWSDLSVNRDIAPNPKATDQRQGSDPYWFGSSDGIEVAVTVTPGTEISDLKLTLIDPKQVAQDAAPSAAPTSSAGAALTMPAVYTRAQWGADESLSGWAPQYMPTIKAATLHHSADGNNYSESDVPGLMRSIYYYQSVTLGWGDIGYNVVVDKFGRAWEGRKGGLDQPVVGAHAGGFNQYTFGVSMLGNYDLVDVPAATKEKVAQLIAWKFKLYGVDPNASTQLTQVGGAGTTAKFSDGQTVTLPTIFGHRQTGNTVCPGQYGYAALPWIRSRAAQIMATLDPPPYYSPEGALAAGVDSSGTLSVNGWLIDRSAIMAPVNGAVTVDGTAVRYFTANGPRPELASYGIPGNHGFAFTTTLSTGSHQVCLYASNVGGGDSNLIDCKTVNYNVKPIATIGALAATGNGNASISVNGWAYDGNAPSQPVVTVITTDGKDARYFYANGPRPELASYGMPGNHGFNFSYGVPTDGAHKVCMYTIEIDNGAMSQTDCKTVTVSGNNPQGYFTAAKSGSTVTVDGWAFDPSDLYANTTVMLTLNGKVVAYSYANRPFADLAYYGVPGNHGFQTAFGAGSGTNSVCLFVMNVGNGADTLVQCRNV